MYADVDKAGRISLMEMSAIDRETLLDALTGHLEGLQATIDLIEGNDYTLQSKESAERLIHVLRQVSDR